MVNARDQNISVIGKDAGNSDQTKGNGFFFIPGAKFASAQALRFNQTQSTLTAIAIRLQPPAATGAGIVASANANVEEIVVDFGQGPFADDFGFTSPAVPASNGLLYKTDCLSTADAALNSIVCYMAKKVGTARNLQVRVHNFSAIPNSADSEFIIPGMINPVKDKFVNFTVNIRKWNAATFAWYSTYYEEFKYVMFTEPFATVDQAVTNAPAYDIAISTPDSQTKLTVQVKGTAAMT
jgi:hypothetical protein